MTTEHHSILYRPVNAVWDGVVKATGLEGRVGEVPDHVVMTLFVVTLCAAVFVPMSRRLSLDEPSPFQQMLELFVQGLRSIIDEMVGEDAARRYLPFVGAFGMFIFLCNFTGQLFFLQPPTQNINTTFALSITAWVSYHVVGIRRHGIGYVKQFLGPMPVLAPLFLPLELISHTARVLSLGLRLFGNIFGEHLALTVFISLVPFLLPIPMMALGLFGAVLQTFIFVMLSIVYIAGAEAEEH